MYDSKFLLYSGDLSYKKIDKKAKDVDGNWTLLSGVIATDSAMASNNRLYNIKTTKCLQSSSGSIRNPPILSISVNNLVNISSVPQ